MSRVGRKPIPIPAGVKVEKKDDLITVVGPRGTLKRSVNAEMKIDCKPDVIVVERPSDLPVHRSLHGVTRSVIANMVEGVTTGFEKRLTIVGTGYRAAVQNGHLILNVGFSHPVDVAPPEGITFETPNVTTVIIKGADKEVVGQLAANIRKIRPPEPYHGKGIRYVDEKVRHKAGKTAK